MSSSSSSSSMPFVLLLLLLPVDCSLRLHCYCSFVFVLLFVFFFVAAPVGTRNPRLLPSMPTLTSAVKSDRSEFPVDCCLGVFVVVVNALLF
jgi:hypothetical protein